jgi:hypothetical protein
MKNTIIAAVLLLVIIGLVIANAIITANIADKLYRLTEEQNLRELQKYWEEKYYFLSLTTNAKMLEEAEKALGDMISYKESESEDEYKAAEKRFVNYVDEIATGEKIIFYNIF